jgi:hypothetical protein
MYQRDFTNRETLIFIVLFIIGFVLLGVIVRHFTGVSVIEL